MMACRDCLRRAWLLGRLAPHLERAPRTRGALRDVLSLTDRAMIDALGGRQRADLLRERDAFDDRIARAQTTAAGLEVVCRHDGSYPPQLLPTGCAPAALFTRGAPGTLDRLAGVPEGADAPPAVAIVGARRAGPDALEMARALGRSLSAAGVTVVSGLALGVDSAAHEGALDGGGRTIAVLCTGADRTYPPSKRALGDRIVAAGGVVVSEMPPGTPPFRWAFPARNRIIAGLASITVVVEAAERSGSLITADFAVQYGREVGAVPGRAASPRCRGSNLLLRDGAHLILEPADVLDGLLEVACLPGVGERLASRPAVPGHLRAVRDAVAASPVSAAAIAGNPDRLMDVLAALAELELLGEIRRTPGGTYVGVVH